MKNAVIKILAAILTVLTLLGATACHKEQRSALAIMREFCGAYGVEGDIYYSSMPNREGELVLSSALGDDVLSLGCDFALMVYGKINTVWEVGVFITDDSADMARLLQLARRRIDFLERFTEAESFILTDGDALVYGFINDKERAVRLIEKIL